MRDCPDFCVNKNEAVPFVANQLKAKKTQILSFSDQLGKRGLGMLE